MNKKRWIVFNIEHKSENKILTKYSFGHFAFGQNLCVYLTLISQYFLTFKIGMVFCIIWSFIAVIGWEILEHTLVKKYVYKNPSFSEPIGNWIMDIVIGLGSFYLLFFFIYILFYNNLAFSWLSFYFSSILVIYAVYLEEFA
jgi:hypothetical protein